MDKKYTFFISSTFKDLIVERRTIANYVLKIGHIPIGMEQFGAIDTSQWQYITRLIDTSDYFILIVAGRYGAVDPADPEGLSYTHKEFRYARENNIPIIGVLHRNPGSISSEFSERDPKSAEKLAAFRDEVGDARLLAFFNDIPELITEVAASISKGMMLFQRPGWTRTERTTGSELAEQNQKLLSEVTKRDREIENLRAQIESYKSRPLHSDTHPNRIDSKDLTPFFDNELGQFITINLALDENGTAEVISLTEQLGILLLDIGRIFSHRQGPFDASIENIVRAGLLNKFRRKYPRIMITPERSEISPRDVNYLVNFLMSKGYVRQYTGGKVMLTDKAVAALELLAKRFPAS